MGMKRMVNASSMHATPRATTATSDVSLRMEEGIGAGAGAIDKAAAPVARRLVKRGTTLGRFTSSIVGGAMARTSHNVALALIYVQKERLVDRGSMAVVGWPKHGPAMGMSLPLARPD